MALFRERLLDGGGHFELSAAEFVLRVCLREYAARREELVQRGIGARLGDRLGIRGHGGVPP